MGPPIKINLAIGLAHFISTSPRHLHCMGQRIMAYGGDYQQPACELLHTSTVTADLPVNGGRQVWPISASHPQPSQHSKLESQKDSA